MRILLVVYDNGGYMHTFPLGVAYIASVLLDAGHDVEIYNQDVHHYPDDHLRKYLDSNKFDIVGVGLIAGYYQYRKIISLSQSINRSKNRPFYILGGHGPTPDPDFFLRKTGADVAVMGEGEVTIVELLSALEKKTPLKEVKGIAFRDGETVIETRPQPLIQNIDEIPFPAYHLFPVEYYRLMRHAHMKSSDFSMNIISGRGCTFKCTFCYRMDKGLRVRSSESIIEEIKFLKSEYSINYIAFADELLMSSVERTADLCEAILKADLGISWYCSGRLNFAEPELLALLKKAGCVYISYGIEAMDNEVLRKMKKGLTTDIITLGIEQTLKAGISPGFNIIFGNIGDNKETLNKGVEFLLKYDDGVELRTIRPVTPYPGSPLYDYAIEKGWLQDCEDFYENKHTNSDLLSVNFTELSDDEFMQALWEANDRLIKNYYKNKLELVLDETRRLYGSKDASFRGFRHT
ncbi:MAG: B12-binding domain-containing radical SAM protein [Deltaproteobacteria bacterium]|nr:B12-binding domain-containing radical SAM protein [Deltaproteobacteria bacterium]